MTANEFVTACVAQDIAATRQRWVMMDRDDYVTSLKFKDDRQAAAAYFAFVKWATERYEYSVRAMAVMGITDYDQAYA